MLLPTRLPLTGLLMLWVALAACAVPQAPGSGPQAPIIESPTETPAGAVSKTAPVGQTTEGYWFLGNPNAPITITVYSDFL